MRGPMGRDDVYPDFGLAVAHFFAQLTSSLNHSVYVIASTEVDVAV
jgi:hypothetical protein